MFGSDDAWLDAPCAFLVCGMPTDPNLPQMPANGGAPPEANKRTFLSEAGLVGLTLLTGGVVFRSPVEKEGATIRQVCSVADSQLMLSSAGAVKLHWHSENATDPVPQQPTTVALNCLLADHDGFFGMRADTQVACPSDPQDITKNACKSMTGLIRMSWWQSLPPSVPRVVTCGNVMFSACGEDAADASGRPQTCPSRGTEPSPGFEAAPRRRTGKGRRSRSPGWSMHAPTPEGQQEECRLAAERACERHEWEMKNINAACLVLDFQPPESWSSLAAADALRAAMGDSHVSGTLSCTGADGRREVLSWTAGSTEIVRSAFPTEAEGWQINGVNVEDDGSVMVAVTRGEGDIRAVQAKFNGDDNEVTTEAGGVTKAIARLSIHETQLPGGLRLRARIVDKHAMQHILPTVKEQLPDGGCCADISEAVHDWDADTQLQLTWSNVIVDRYNLSAADITAIHEDAAEAKSESDIIVHSAPSLATSTAKKSGP